MFYASQTLFKLKLKTSVIMRYEVSFKSENCNYEVVGKSLFK